jgi:hypothetical protein
MSTPSVEAAAAEQDHDRYREALLSITRYKHTPRAYRHQKFEHLIKIAEDALRNS